MTDPILLRPCSRCGQTDWTVADADGIAKIVTKLRERVPELPDPDRVFICNACGAVVTDLMTEFRAAGP